MSRTVAIVDPYSGGALLAPGFLERGWDCVMVQSTAEVPPRFRSSLRPADYREILRHRDDDGATMDRLRDLGVELVVAGCDLGVVPAARWSEGLGLVGNGARSAAACRDKRLMAERAHRQGLATARQISTGRLEDALEWIRSHGRWPVILKPVASTSSDGVTACDDERQVARAFPSIVGRTDVLGQINEQVLVQERLEGTEYVVDTVSREGRHRLAAIWRYHRSGLPVGYDAMQLEEGEGALADELFGYAARVLDALGIRHGPGHCEIMVDGGRLTLVEVASRPTSGINFWLNRLCGGVCQLDLMLDVHTAPERFLAGLGERYTLRRHAVNVFLRPPVGGRLKALPRLAELETLGSLYHHSVNARPGQPVPEVAGIVTLLHPERAVVEADLARVRELEAGGLFEIETD